MISEDVKRFNNTYLIVEATLPLPRELDLISKKESITFLEEKMDAYMHVPKKN